MRVATFEFDVRTRDVPNNLAAVLTAIEAASAHGVRLLALPEMWPTSFAAEPDLRLLESSDRAVDEAAAAADAAGVAIVGSAFCREGVEAAQDRSTEAPTNRAHVFDGGRLVASYDKVHLFSPTAEHLAFRAGDRPPMAVDLAVGTDTCRVAPLVCYDLRFPDVARAAFRDGAEVLVVVAQWPAPRIAHWDALVRGRAAEMLGYVVANNRVGTDLIGRRKLELSFPGHSFVAGPGADVESAAIDLPQTNDASCAGARLAMVDLDLGAIRELRRVIPVERDERPEVFRAW